MESKLSVSSTIDSRVEAVDAAEASVRSFAQQAGFGDEDLYFLGLAAREILINAIVHGNRFDLNEKVTLQLSLEHQRLTIEVLDAGAGFQLDAVPDPRSYENRERLSGRGIAMAKAIMDEFSVEQNPPHGTRVRMMKMLKQGE